MMNSNLCITLHDPINAFLNYNEEALHTRGSHLSIFYPSNASTKQCIGLIFVTSSSSRATPSIRSTTGNHQFKNPGEPCIHFHLFALLPASALEVSTPPPPPPIIPASSTAQSEYYTSKPRSFCGNPPAFFPPPVTPLLPVSQSYTAQVTDTLAKIIQLQRLPQAFESLIDSAPVTARQKLHLLYQYLGGKAKKVVEQLQYLVQDPESAYQEARKILKERFGNPAIISTDFEKKLTTWPKVGPNDATGLEEFSDFLQQVKIASKHIESLKVLSYPSQIQVLVEKLPGWFKAKCSDKLLKLQKKKVKDAFPCFEEFAEEVRYHAERYKHPSNSAKSRNNWLHNL